MTSESGASSSRSKRTTGVLALLFTTVVGSLVTGFGTKASESAWEFMFSEEKKSNNPTVGKNSFQDNRIDIEDNSLIDSNLSPSVIVEKFEKVTVPLVISVVGEGESEESSQKNAIEMLQRDATKKCEKINLEQKGVSYELRSFTPRSKTCAAVGGHWRCLADAKPDCVVFGGN